MSNIFLENFCEIFLETDFQLHKNWTAPSDDSEQEGELLSYDGVGNVKIEFMWCVMSRTGLDIQTLGTYQQDTQDDPRPFHN